VGTAVLIQHVFKKGFHNSQRRITFQMSGDFLHVLDSNLFEQLHARY
jgi:hypothetical protein